MKTSGLVVALLFGFFSLSPAGAAPVYQVVPSDAGGIEVWLSTVNSDDGHTPTIQLVGRDVLRDIKYLISKTDNNGSAVLAQGELGGIRTGEFKQVGDPDEEITGRARFEVCVSFLNLRTQKNHILVSFFEENVAVASGGTFIAQAEEYAAPLRLTTDGSMTCQEALDHDFVMELGHDSRIRNDAAATVEPARSELREGIFHIMTFAPSGKELHYDIEIGTARSLADAEFKVEFSPLDGGANPVIVGSRLAYLAPSYILQPRKMMGIGEYPDKLPSRAVRIQACATYFDVADQAYWKESWFTETSLAEQLASPEGEGGRYHYPDQPTWEHSDTRLHC